MRDKKTRKVWFPERVFIVSDFIRSIFFYPVGSEKLEFSSCKTGHNRNCYPIRSL